MLGPIQILHVIFLTGSSASWRFVYGRRFPIKNSQHWVKYPTCKDLINETDIYLWSSCLSSLFSCSNFSRRTGSCLDAFMRSSVDHSLLFTLADELDPLKETFPQGWMEFDTGDLRKCAMAEPNFHKHNVVIGNSWTSRMFLFLEARPEVGYFGSLRTWSRHAWVTLIIYLKHIGNSNDVFGTFHSKI